LNSLVKQQQTGHQSQVINPIQHGLLGSKGRGEQEKAKE